MNPTYRRLVNTPYLHLPGKIQKRRRHRCLQCYQLSSESKLKTVEISSLYREQPSKNYLHSIGIYKDYSKNLHGLCFGKRITQGVLNTSAPVQGMPASIRYLLDGQRLGFQKVVGPRQVSWGSNEQWTKTLQKPIFSFGNPNINLHLWLGVDQRYSSVIYSMLFGLYRGFY